MSRTHRCGHCSGCLSEPCGTCPFCLDNPAYGGPGVKKQTCIARRCERVLRSKIERGGGAALTSVESSPVDAVQSRAQIDTSKYYHWIKDAANSPGVSPVPNVYRNNQFNDNVVNNYEFLNEKVRRAVVDQNRNLSISPNHRNLTSGCFINLGHNLNGTTPLEHSPRYVPPTVSPYFVGHGSTTTSSSLSTCTSLAAPPLNVAAPTLKFATPPCNTMITSASNLNTAAASSSNVSTVRVSSGIPTSSNHQHHHHHAMTSGSFVSAQQQQRASLLNANLNNINSINNNNNNNNYQSMTSSSSNFYVNSSRGLATTTTTVVVQPSNIRQSSLIVAARPMGPMDQPEVLLRQL